MLTFICPEDDAIAVLHDAEDAQLDVGQVHPLPVHLQGGKPSQPTASFTTTQPEIKRDRPSFLVLQTLSKSFRHCSLPRVMCGVFWEVKSM
jgi:hypothetical protein